MPKFAEPEKGLRVNTCKRGRGNERTEDKFTRSGRCDYQTLVKIRVLRFICLSRSYGYKFRILGTRALPRRAASRSLAANETSWLFEFNVFTS